MRFIRAWVHTPCWVLRVLNVNHVEGLCHRLHRPPILLGFQSIQLTLVLSSLLNFQGYLLLLEAGCPVLLLQALNYLGKSESFSLVVGWLQRVHTAEYLVLGSLVQWWSRSTRHALHDLASGTVLTVVVTWFLNINNNRLLNLLRSLQKTLLREM